MRGCGTGVRDDGDITYFHEIKIAAGAVRPIYNETVLSAKNHEKRTDRFDPG